MQEGGGEEAEPSAVGSPSLASDTVPVHDHTPDRISGMQQYRHQGINLLLPLASLILVALGLTLFVDGFLLSRVAIQDISRCDPAELGTAGLIPSSFWPVPKRDQGHLSQLDTGENNDDTKASVGSLSGMQKQRPGCWLPRPAYQRAVILVVDALRFDFIKYNASLGDPGNQNYQKETLDSGHHIEFFRNRLPSLHRALHTAPLRARMFRFRADPPTVTMQRIKALTTGGLPTFADAKDNFAAGAISEDSWISQAEQNGINVTFMGDDTWADLFPSAFSSSFPYPSFNVKDLHTVDNGVIKHLFPALSRRVGSPEIVIGHFLGVDHVGHRYQADHIAMQSKLEQMDVVLQKVFELVDKPPLDTIVFVMGDHGMTAGGDHGGASSEEVDAGMFVYSSKPVFVADHRDGEIPGRAHLLRRQHAKKHTALFGTVPQIDIVPTISLLLGLPIPFGNLGQVIPELFYATTEHPTHSDSSSSVDSDLGHVSPEAEAAARKERLVRLQRLCLALLVNALQVDRYIRTYRGVSPSFGGEEIVQLSATLDELQTRVHQAASKKQGFTVSEQDWYDLASELQNYLSRSGELCREKWTRFRVPMMSSGIVVVIFGSVVMAMSTWAIPAFGWGATPRWLAKFIGCASALVLILILLGIAIEMHLVAIVALGCGCVWLFSVIFDAVSRANLAHCFRSGARIKSIFPVLAVLIVLQGFFSNSFIIAENAVVHMLVVVLWIVVGLYDSTSFWPRSSTAQVLQRLLWWIFFLVSPIASASLWDLSASGKSIDLSFGDGASFSFGMRFIIYASIVALSLASAMVFRATNPTDDQTRLSKTLSRSTFPYGLRALLSLLPGLVLMFWLVPTTKSGSFAHQDLFSLWIPRFVYCVSLLVLGYTFVSGAHRSRFQTWGFILLSFSSPFLLVLGPRGAPLAVLMMIVSFGLVELAKRRVLTPLELAVMLWFLGQHFFFSSGHSANIGSLQIASAFVGFDQFHMIPAGSLLVLNTFGGPIWATLVVFLICELDPVLRPQSHVTQRYQSTLFSSYLLLCCLRLCTACAASAVHRRHLMVWAIFAPKFAFEATQFALVLLLSSIFSISSLLFRRGVSLKIRSD